jgi:hypothetical protein
MHNTSTASNEPAGESSPYEWIDDAFRIKETRYGLFTSILKSTGKDFLTGGTYDAVLTMSRWHLKCEQEGTLHLYTRVVGSIRDLAGVKL